MHSRRSAITALAAGLAVPALAGVPALAHNRNEPYVMPDDFLPTLVGLRNPVEPGEIHVDPFDFRLYWTLPNNVAIRYTVGIGRARRYVAGTFTIKRKAKWPSWTPTKNMIAREPGKYARFAGGVPGGPNNPLGARALYLYTDTGRDTMLRIHGTNVPWTIASEVSNGCARLVNDHAKDLYERVPLGTKVVLHPRGKGARAVI